MMADILTVIWKELRELFLQRGTRRGTLTSVGILLFLFGVVIPFQLGRAWVDTPAGLIYWCWLPFMMVNNVIADSFAGERERHTLETLLASRLSDLSILLGKVSTAVLYGWGTSILGMLLALLTVNVFRGQGELLLYPPVFALGAPLVSFLVAGLAAGIGVLVSLHASTVRQAQQTVGMAFFIVLLPLFFLPMLPPEWKLVLANFLQTANFAAIGTGALISVSVIDVVLILISAVRFRRDKLILD
jgi:ABC-2 type transport system permease protein